MTITTMTGDGGRITGVRSQGDRGGEDNRRKWPGCQVMGGHNNR